MPENQDQQHTKHDFDGIVENRETSPPPYFTILFYGLILWGVAFSAYYLLSGWSSEKEFTQNMQTHQERYSAQGETTSAGTGSADTEAAQIDARGLYAASCSVCHGAEATGGIGPDLTGEYKYGKGPADVIESISKGRPGGMPAFGNQLSKPEIEALATHLLTL